MVITTITGVQMYQITPLENNEVIYVNNIPLSVQQKCNVSRNIAIRYCNGKPLVYNCRREINPSRVPHIIKVLNGYARENNKVRYR